MGPGFRCAKTLKGWLDVLTGAEKVCFGMQAMMQRWAAEGKLPLDRTTPCRSTAFRLSYVDTAAPLSIVFLLLVLLLQLLLPLPQCWCMTCACPASLAKKKLQNEAETTPHSPPTNQLPPCPTAQTSSCPAAAASTPLPCRLSAAEVAAAAAAAPPRRRPGPYFVLGSCCAAAAG